MKAPAAKEVQQYAEEAPPAGAGPHEGVLAGWGLRAAVRAWRRAVLSEAHTSGYTSSFCNRQSWTGPLG